MHGHQHQMAKPSEEMPMDCGHNMNQMSACKMSCCKTAEQAAIFSQVFILPILHLRMQTTPAISPVPQQEVQRLSQYEKPQSPPPRYIAA